MEKTLKESGGRKKDGGRKKEVLLLKSYDGGTRGSEVKVAASVRSLGEETKGKAE